MPLTRTLQDSLLSGVAGKKKGVSPCLEAKIFLQFFLVEEQASNKKLAAGAKGVGRKRKESDISYALGFEDSLLSHSMFGWVAQKMWGLKRMDTPG